jgi:hypothetical protein
MKSWSIPGRHPTLDIAHGISGKVDGFGGRTATSCDEADKKKGYGKESQGR